MTDPKKELREHDEPDELELDAETVKDLEAEPESGEAVRGGAPCKDMSCIRFTCFNLASGG
jgi:hypothetical protein